MPFIFPIRLKAQLVPTMNSDTVDARPSHFWLSVTGAHSLRGWPRFRKENEEVRTNLWRWLPFVRVLEPDANPL
jgi:hypothetical protein